MKRYMFKTIVMNKQTYIKRIILFITQLAMSTHVWGQVLIPGTNSSNESPFNMDVPTPTVASLGKYGDVPVSYYTGTPNISIPLYELKSRDISMPITLDYDASGVMVNNLPSWAGQNWILNIGGVIIRSKRGAIDEKELSDYLVRNEYVHNNYFKNHDKIQEVVSDPSNSYKKLKDVLKGIGGSWDMSPDIFTFHFWGKSGKFFLGNDGEWKVVSNDNLDIVFDYNDDNNYSTPIFEMMPSLSVRGEQKKTISGFVIRDDNGNIYRFGYDKNATEYTTNIWHMSKNEHDESWYANSWYLTSVKDRFGNTLLEFNYERGAYVIQVFNYFNYQKYSVNWTGFSQDVENISSEFPYTMSISSPVYLKSISGGGTTIKVYSSYVSDEMATEKLYESFYRHFGITNTANVYWNNFYKKYFQNRVSYFADDDYIGNFFYIQGYGNTKMPEGFNSSAKAKYEKMLNMVKSCRYDRDYADDKSKMDFLRYSRIRILDSLTITGNNGSMSYIFQHGYHNRRMLLESLIHTGKAHGSQETYKFIYNNPDQLPSDYLTTAVDYWGRYNGKGYNIDDVFNMEISSHGVFFIFYKGIHANVNYNSVDCSVDPRYASIGILTEIQYPTGGTASFEYESNDFNYCMSNDRQSLLEVQGNNIVGGLRVKSIKNYDSPTHKNLLRERYFTYNMPNSDNSSGILFSTPVNKWDFNMTCETSGVSWRTELFRTTSVVPLANMSGVSLGYSYVTETDYDFKNCNSQKTVYHYSNLSDENVRDKKAIISFTKNDTPYDNFCEMDFMRGKILDEKIYDEEERLIHSTEYVYRKDNFLNENFSYTSNMGAEFTREETLHFTGGIAKIYYAKYDVVKKIEKTYIYNVGNIPMEISTVTQYDKQDISYISDYPYTHEINARLLLAEDVTSGKKSEKKVYDYRHFPGGKSLSTTSDAYNDTFFVYNWSSNDKNFEWYLYSKMFFLKPSVTSYFKNGNLIQKIRDRYTKISNIIGDEILVTNKTIADYPTGDSIIMTDYMQYDATGRPLIYKTVGQPKTYLLWGGIYNNYLLLKSDSPISLSSGSLPLGDENTSLSRILNYMDIGKHATGYVYGPFFNISKSITSNRNVTTYKYDDFYRLCGIYDNGGNLIDSYEYNYRKQ